ncbi:MAG: hypothetical protein GF364_04655 [Candidatus Lokiarchaeota archaeon]|nr:hypothetical protein [Candidatus Lokiarchaeota archaeon]
MEAKERQVIDILENIKGINNKHVKNLEYSENIEYSDDKSETALNVEKKETESNKKEETSKNNNVKGKEKKKVKKKKKKQQKLKKQQLKQRKKKKKLTKPPGAKEARYQFTLYIILWLIYFLVSILLPLALFFLYFLEVLKPYVWDILNPGNWDKWWYHLIYQFDLSRTAPVLQNPLSLFIVLSSPLVFTGLYLFKMFMYALIMKIYYWIFNKIEPRKEMTNAPPWGKTANQVMMYHTRNFLLKIIKWEFIKSPFPWLLNWMYNFVGSNSIGKGTTFEDSYVSTEYLETGENVYHGYGTVTTAHLVEGSYGALTLQKIKLKDNACIGSRCAVPPGAEFGENSQLLWYSGVIKYQKVRDKKNYWGLPAGRLSRGRYKRLLQFPDEILKKEKEKRNAAKRKKKAEQAKKEEKAKKEIQTKKKDEQTKNPQESKPANAETK